jgi:hypothetical protein
MSTKTGMNSGSGCTLQVPWQPRTNAIGTGALRFHPAALLPYPLFRQFAASRCLHGKLMFVAGIRQQQTVHINLLLKI